MQQKDLYDKLDLILKFVFNYFDQETENEFAKLPKYEQLTVKTYYLKPNRQLFKTIEEKLSAFNFFQIQVMADLEFEGKTYKNVKQKNNDSILTPENWEQQKDTFFKQRMETYKDSYTYSEKIKLELETLEKLPINKTDYQILKGRYNEYLKTLPPQPITKQKLELNETQLSEKIKKYFGFLLGNCPRKGKPILNNENDLNELVEWTTYFFENNFEVPEISNPINSVNTNKYITQLAFQILFDELRKEGFHNQRTRAKTLFNLWESSFLDYKGDKKNNFWKVKKKNDSGIDYDTEVKKLMLIDY